MAALRPEALSGLEQAARDEAAAARGLASALSEAGGALAALDTARLEGALRGAKACADVLSQRASARAALTRLAARALGLSDGASLSDVQAVLGCGAASGFGDAARTLAEGLDAASREASAHALAARFGAELWAHRVGLSRGATGTGSYGPHGRMQPASARLGRHV